MGCSNYKTASGAATDIPEYLKSRIQYWVGENDNDPNHPQIDQSNTVTSVQGADRVVDTDRTRGENSADTIFIGAMIIRSQS